MSINSLRRGRWCLSVLLAAAAATSTAIAAPDGSATETLNLGLRGVYFVPNQGQWSDSEVQYGLRSRGLDVAFRESSFTMHLRREKGEDAKTFVEIASDAREETAAEYDTLTLGVTFPGSNPVLPEGAQPQVARVNYFVGGEGRGVASNVPSFGSVVYADLYDGIDLHVVGNDDGVLKYEFHVAPGMDYSQIRIAYDGIESLCIDDGGDLQIKTTFGTLTDAAPLVWQDIDGERCFTFSRFEVVGDTTYRIALDGEFDPAHPLVVDPELHWVYFVGGGDSDFLTGLAVDQAGNAILTGYTYSTDFVGRNNSHHGHSFDAFLVKVNPSGAVVWMTYLGGSDTDTGRGAAVRSDGGIVCSGETRSTDLERRTNSYHGGGKDCFVASVDPLGQLEWMTYVGGTGTDTDAALSIGPDSTALIAGQTNSTDWQQATNTFYGGSYDAFLVSVDELGSVQWMSYVGGTDFEEAATVAVDSASNLLISGRTESEDFIGRVNSNHGGTDAFVSKLNSEGELLWTRYLGGASYDHGNSVCVDSNDNVVLVGQTRAIDFEGRINSFHGGGYDAFVLKLSPSSDLLWMVYLGGGNKDDAESVAVATDGSMFATGTTLSDDFEGRTNFYRRHQDGFVTRLDSDGDVQWMIYIGGSERESRATLVLDGLGSAYVAGSTGSANFPGRRNEMYDEFDVFLLKMSLEADSNLVADSSCPRPGPIEIGWSSASPDGRVILLFARSTTWPLTIPQNNPCAGTALDLGTDRLRTVWIGRSDQNGGGFIRGNAASAACGGYLQLLDLTTCATSNVARIE